MRAAALAGHVAADYELLAAAILDLDPVGAAPPGPVRAREPLGDDPLEAAFARGGEEGLAVADAVPGGLPGRTVKAQLGQQLPPPLVRIREQ